MTLLRDNWNLFLKEMREMVSGMWCFTAHSPYHVDEGLSWWCKKCHAKEGGE